MYDKSSATSERASAEGHAAYNKHRAQSLGMPAAARQTGRRGGGGRWMRCNTLRIWCVVGLLNMIQGKRWKLVGLIYKFTSFR